jgi:hypothetical protein
MVRNDGAEARRERMERIARNLTAAFNENRTPMLSVAVAEIIFSTGLSETKVYEYLGILHKLGKIVLDQKADRILRPES